MNPNQPEESKMLEIPKLLKQLTPGGTFYGKTDDHACISAENIKSVSAALRDVEVNVNKSMTIPVTEIKMWTGHTMLTELRLPEVLKIIGRVEPPDADGSMEGQQKALKKEAEAAMAAGWKEPPSGLRAVHRHNEMFDSPEQYEAVKAMVEWNNLSLEERKYDTIKWLEVKRICGVYFEKKAGQARGKAVLKVNRMARRLHRGEFE